MGFFSVPIVVLNLVFMYCKFLIKFVVLHSLLVCCEFAGRVVCCFYFRLTQGKDPSHNAPLPFLKQQKLMSMKRSKNCWPRTSVVQQK